MGQTVDRSGPTLLTFKTLVERANIPTGVVGVVGPPGPVDVDDEPFLDATEPDDNAAPEIPATFAEMRDAFMGLIWKQRGSLKGTALVQALNSLARLAELDISKPDDEPEQDVLDLIQNDGLLPARKQELLEAERVVAAARLARINTELEALCPTTP